MSAILRAAALLAVLSLASSAPAPAATPKEIEAAKKRGTDWIKARYARGGGGGGGDAGHGIGPTCLAGLALLEGGVPPADPAVKSVTDSVRAAAYTQTKTYQVALCLMYLDRLGEPADVPLIQALGVRLLAGQNANGGWTYESVGGVPEADVQRLKAIKADQPAGKFHPEIQKYAQTLAAQAGKAGTGDDNSNSQFAVIAVWMARKHGVPVETALDLIEKRYLASQNLKTGGWSYSGVGMGDGSDGSPSMTCAGLIGLSTAIARREERRAKLEQPKKEPPKGEPGVEPKKAPDDPFFNPPPGVEPKKAPKRPADHRDQAAMRGFANLGFHVLESARAGRGTLTLGGEGGGHGKNDLYFFWSVERVGVIYGIEKIGGVDWYDAGTTTLVRAQAADGSWTGGHGSEVDTSFALLFLNRSNLARDLSGKVQKDTLTEMRAGAAPVLDPKTGDVGTDTNPAGSVPFLPGVTGNQAATLAAELTKAAGKDWSAALVKLRDGKGDVYTRAMVLAVTRLDGERRGEAREVLAERLTKMTPKTLRWMMKSEEAELRRGAVLAMAMKDDKAHVPDLVAALEDEEDFVVRAARAGLRSLTGEDFGPANNATAGEKTVAANAWRQWLAKMK